MNKPKKALDVLKSGTTNPVIIAVMVDVIERRFNHMQNTLDMQADHVDELKSDLSLCRQHEWIPVSERLPDRDERVLVFCAGEVYKAHIDWQYKAHIDWQGEWHDSESGDYLIPTHWMPLPEPPSDNLRGNDATNND